MVITTSTHKPNYFLLVFGVGLPNPPEGGVYPMTKKGYISDVSAGDVLLLWESLGFQGIGVVTSTETGAEKETINYQYFPLCHPVDWDSLDAAQKTIPELRKPLNFIGNFVQRISNASFRAAIAGRQIDWPQ